jgi:hypothetical protein
MDSLSHELEAMLELKFDLAVDSSHEEEFIQKLEEHMKIHEEITTLTNNRDDEYEDINKRLKLQVIEWKTLAERRLLQLQSLKSKFSKKLARTGHAKQQIMEIYAI